MRPRTSAVPVSRPAPPNCAHRVSLPHFPCSERTGVAAYLRDAVGMLLVSRTNEPLGFMDGYFQSVLRGDNVLMRNFAYVNATTRNRLSFIVAMQETFGDCEWPEPIAPQDYLELLRQLCPDFPRPLVNAAAAAVLPLLLPHSEGHGEDHASPRVSFETLSLACNLWFFFAGTCPSHTRARIHTTMHFVCTPPPTTTPPPPPSPPQTSPPRPSIASAGSRHPSLLYSPSPVRIYRPRSAGLRAAAGTTRSSGKRCRQGERGRG